MRLTLQVAMLQGAEHSRKDIIAILGATELEVRAAEARLTRARDGLVLGLSEDGEPIFQQ